MTRPPRIAIDFRPARLGRSGIPRVVRELARALAKRGDIDLHLFGHAYARSRVAAPIPGATVHGSRLPGRSLPWLARIGVDAARLAGGSALFHWTDYVFPPVRAALPTVWTLHDAAFLVDPRWHGADARRLTARAEAIAARATRIVCPTRTTARIAAERLGVPDAKLAVVPWGVDHLGDGPVDPPPDGHLIAVGTLEPRKNHLRLLAAWRRLGADRPPLVIVGRVGWCCADVVAEIEREIASGAPLTWHRDADDDALERLLAGARALLYPSLHEGFGLPAVEGLARGLPVVAGDHPALVEATLGGAIHVDATSIDAIVAGIHDALRPEAIAAAAAAGARLVAARRWDDAAAGYAAVYLDCLDPTPRGPRRPATADAGAP